MYIGIATKLKSGLQWFTTECKTRSQARREALKLCEYQGNRIDFKIQTKSLESFKLYTSEN